MMLIIGKGHLAQALQSKWPDACVVGRPEFDFAYQADCDRLVAQFPTPDVVINTLGCITDNIWHNLTVNFVAPAYITSCYAHNTQCHIINISSASAWWPSFPGMDLAQFSYKAAKESLSQFGRHMNRITIDDDSKALVSTVEPGRFQSPMSNWTGREISDIVDCVQLVIDRRLQHISLVK